MRELHSKKPNGIQSNGKYRAIIQLDPDKAEHSELLACMLSLDQIFNYHGKGYNLAKLIKYGMESEAGARLCTELIYEKLGLPYKVKGDFKMLLDPRTYEGNLSQIMAEAKQTQSTDVGKESDVDRQFDVAPKPAAFPAHKQSSEDNSLPIDVPDLPGTQGALNVSIFASSAIKHVRSAEPDKPQVAKGALAAFVSSDDD